MLNPQATAVVANAKALAALFMIVFVLVLMGASYQYGGKHARQAAEVKEAKAIAAAVDLRQKENDATLAQERQLRATDFAEYEKYIGAHNEAIQETDRIIAGLRSDAIRLRVPVKPRPAAGQADSSGPPAPGTEPEGQAELTADAGEFLVDLLARGDDGIRKHAEVVDRYDRLRTACSAVPEVTP